MTLEAEVVALEAEEAVVATLEAEVVALEAEEAVVAALEAELVALELCALKSVVLNVYASFKTLFSSSREASSRSCLSFAAPLPSRESCVKRSIHCTSLQTT